MKWDYKYFNKYIKMTDSNIDKTVMLLVIVLIFLIIFPLLSTGGVTSSMSSVSIGCLIVVPASVEEFTNGATHASIETWQETVNGIREGVDQLRGLKHDAETWERELGNFSTWMKKGSAWIDEVGKWVGKVGNWMSIVDSLGGITEFAKDVEEGVEEGWSVVESGIEDIGKDTWHAL